VGNRRAVREPRRPSVARREVLQGLAALVAAGWMPATFAQRAPSGAQLAGLSSALTGGTYADPAIAAAMFGALTQAIGAGKLGRLARLAASTPAAQLGDAIAAANLGPAAETVVAALFSGVVDTPRGPVVISYDQALVWQSLGWTKPNAFCGGQTDYWASAPTVS